MSDIAIRAEGLGKKYYIGGVQARYKTLRETLAETFTSPFRRAGQILRGRVGGVAGLRDEFWALKDVSFEIKEGEVVGVIGRNGAGKSTLLKILSRITEPTEGYVDIYGRVGSLLEVGTGFHPELTGRENIYLNGAILGMKRREINRKFDEIVAFAEVEPFLDTPAKHYSSGMYMRLAFAVAAHLEPEILVVDEVLAVGDAAFQQKSLGKMGEIAGQGRTVLFVSHNMAAIQRLCRTAILLDHGRVSIFGNVLDVTSKYLQQGADSQLQWEREAIPTKDAYIHSVRIVDEDNQPLKVVTTATQLRVIINYVIKRKRHGLQISLGLLDSMGAVIFGSSPQDAGTPSPEEPGEYQAIVTLPSEILLPKAYSIRSVLWIANVSTIDVTDNIHFVALEAASLANTVHGGRAGVLAIHCNWSVEAVGLQKEQSF